MRKSLYLSIAIIAFALSSCGVKTIPIKGDYFKSPFEVTVDKSKEKAWDDVIDFFAQTGLTIKLIDYNSGLIISERTNFGDKFTFEKREGGLMEPDTYVVLESMKRNGSQVIPRYVTAEWNVRIKSLGNDRSVVNINVVNIESHGIGENSTKLPLLAKSTGVFEKRIVSAIIK